MQKDEQLEALIDEVTRRVQMRLERDPHGTDAQVLGRQCSTTENCEACGGCHVKHSEAVRNIVDRGATRITAAPGHGPAASDLAPLIDHTLLKPEATREQLKKLCDEARKYGFATVCVNPVNVRYCAAQLEGSKTKAIAVIGFPLGASTPAAKAYEARDAVRNGAAEIDMVINVGALKNREYRAVLEDISAVVAASVPRPVKVILETGLLDHDQKVIACVLSKVAGAAFVKTSTGFGPGGATAEDIALMRATVGPDMGVKASGGVRTEEDVRRMVAAGATRIGASASVEIVSGKQPDAKKKLRVVGDY